VIPAGAVLAHSGRGSGLRQSVKMFSHENKLAQRSGAVPALNQKNEPASQTAEAKWSASMSMLECPSRAIKRSSPIRTKDSGRRDPPNGDFPNFPPPPPPPPPPPAERAHCGQGTGRIATEGGEDQQFAPSSAQAKTRANLHCRS